MLVYDSDLRYSYIIHKMSDPRDYYQTKTTRVSVTSKDVKYDEKAKNVCVRFFVILC